MRSSSILGAILTLGWAAAAGASPSIDLYFTKHNGTAIADATNLMVAPGDEIGVEARITSDERGITLYTFSIDYDSAGLGRLDLLNFLNTPPPELPLVLGEDTPWGPDDARGEPGYIKFFVGASLDPNPDTRNKVFTLATATFLVTEDILDGPASIAPGFFFPPFDEVLSADDLLIGGDYDFQSVFADYAARGVSLTVVPEPSSAVLVGAALTLLASSRRRRGVADQISRRS